ncbi:hypothetical protein NM208_g13512 [Fusarium decemcellulare]|uniref:Uncharacterized protein n=1 Tax=Fusarium decemcellulare TaxID=57161 RepID=A0ACC1RLD2_9HYPO|nr:hypothetical protein NM208_g13512 [Fusarium decemcellulare]
MADSTWAIVNALVSQLQLSPDESDTLRDRTKANSQNVLESQPTRLGGGDTVIQSSMLPDGLSTTSQDQWQNEDMVFNTDIGVDFDLGVLEGVWDWPSVALNNLVRIASLAASPKSQRASINLIQDDDFRSGPRIKGPSSILIRLLTENNTIIPVTLPLAKSCTRLLSLFWLLSTRNTAIASSFSRLLKQNHPAREMASTFHQFSRLPAEVRLQIWEEACFPRQSCGLHYATLDTKTHFVTLDFPGNGSAYSWDGGLWMACKESRAVLEKHHYMKEWKQSDLRDPTEYQYSKSWMESEKEAPGLLAVRNDHQEWHCVAYPARDIFCINAHNNDWQSLMTWKSYGLSITVPFLEDTMSLYVDNVALEFDPSWNLDLPTYLYEFDDRKSSLGFLARMLAEVARGDSRATNIWLIDNNARWRANSKRDLGPVVYDCDREYIEVDVDDIYIDEPYEDSINYFISRFGYDFDYDDNWPPHYYGSTWESEFSARETIRLLVRRDNQMTKYLD